MNRTYQRRPHWLKVRVPAGDTFHTVRRLVQQNGLHTVCQSAHCPNIGECWGQGTATFLILGEICTRNCGFCAIQHGVPQPIDPNESRRVAQAVQTLDLQYAVITSVTRDDLADGGASIFAATITEIHQSLPNCAIEVLIPDFQGDGTALHTVLAAQPTVLNHNLETVPRLYSQVRPQADYQRSLTLLARAKAAGATTKSGLMLGLGETQAEVLAVMRDLRQIDCDLLTLGQYLQPSQAHLPLVRFVTPAEFEALREAGLELGFRRVESAPLVRSSYHAEKSLQKS
ncbi:lipoyl synthase [candidate division KSB1 bacterium]|nr:lipoyl synthase [candidate division KSB1 bacterium]